MVTDLVRTATPEEREYARLLGEIDRLKGVVADLQRELAELQADIAAFEAEYHATIGPLYLEIDRLRTAIRQYELQIARLHDHPDADPETIEREVLDDMRSAWERVRQDEEENRAWQEARTRQQQLPELKPDEKEDLMRIYRELARRHHPDLARTEEERLLREPVMQRINEALASRDFATLSSMMAESEFVDSAFEAKGIGDKIVWAIREISRLADVTLSIEREIADKHSSESAQALAQTREGNDVIGAIQSQLEPEVASLTNQLEALIAVWVRLGR